MTVLEALQTTVESIKTWIENNFLNKKNIDSALSTTSTNPVQNKVVNDEIKNIKTSIENFDVSEKVQEAVKNIDYPVDSVNGKTGSVMLTASDVDALPSSTNIPSKLSDLTDDSTHRIVTDVEKEKWNAKSDFSGSYNDLVDTPTIPSSADDFGVYVQKTEPTDAIDDDIWIDLSSDPSIMEQELPDVTDDDNGKFLGVQNGEWNVIDAPSNEHTCSVSSVNGKTGIVKLTASDIGLSNVDNVKQYSESNQPPYPVTSVNGKTGAITLPVLPDVTTADNGKVLMVVDGAWQVVDLNLSIDADGVLSV